MPELALEVTYPYINSLGVNSLSNASIITNYTGSLGVNSLSGVQVASYLTPVISTPSVAVSLSSGVPSGLSTLIQGAKLTSLITQCRVTDLWLPNLSQVKLQSLIKEKTVNTGNTGVIGLASIKGYARISSAYAGGSCLIYCIDSGGDREIGIGKYLILNRLERVTPLVTYVNGILATNPYHITLTGISIIGVSANTYSLKALDQMLETRTFMLMGCF